MAKGLPKPKQDDLPYPPIITKLNACVYCRANGVCANETGYVTGNETGIFCNLERQQIIGTRVFEKTHQMIWFLTIYFPLQVYMLV